MILKIYLLTGILLNTVEPTFKTTLNVISSDGESLTENMKENQNKTTVTKITANRADNIVVTIDGGTNSLNLVEPKTGWGSVDRLL